MKLFALIVIPSFALIAAPSGLQVIHGEVYLTERDSSSIEVKVSDRALLDWNQFSVGENESLSFLQPSSESIAVNRVIGSEPSAIFGSLRSNGKVVLINPMGILFGKESRIDTGSFIATTLDIHKDLMIEKGKLSFAGGSEFSIKNLGQISAQGFVYLIGSKVEQVGTIGAPISGVIAQNRAGVSLDGEIELFKNESAKNCFAFVNGEICGEKILVFGDLIDIESNTRLRAVSNVGGGVIEIGGVPDGSRSLADLAYVAQGAVLDASADNSGNGGEVSIWGKRGSQFFGRALARGGALQGDGGKIEVSAMGGVEYRGSVDTSAPCGKTGLFILDPCDIFINNTGVGTSVPVFSATYTPGVNASVSIDDISAAIAGSNVSLNTSPGAGGSGDITWEEFFDLTYASANSLTFNADRNVTIRSDVQNMGVGDIIVNAGGAVFIGDAANTTVAQLATNGNMDIDCVSGFTITAGNGLPANAGVTAAGMLTIDVSNGDFHMDAVTNSDATGVSGNPIIINVPQGSFLNECANSGTTGFTFTDYLSIIVRDDITYLSATNGRNETVGTFLGTPCLIESTAGNIIFQNTSGQRLRFVGNYPLTIRAAGNFLFESTSPIGQTVIQTGPNAVVIDAGGDIVINALVGIGPAIIFNDTLFAIAGGDISITQGLSGLFAALSNSGITWIAGGNFTADLSSAVANMIIGTSVSGPILIQSGGNTNLFANSAQNIAFGASGGTFSIQAGGNINYASSSTGLVITSGELGVTLDSGANINLLDNAQVFSAGTDIFLRANISMRMNPTSLIDFTAPLVPGSTVTLIVDDEFPFPPLMGSGGFIMQSGAQIMTVERPPIAIYTSQQGLNFIAGQINGASFSSGTLFIDTNEEQWCTYFPNGQNVLPFRVHYKNCLQQATSQATLVVAEFLVDLHPYNEFPGWYEQFSLSSQVSNFEMHTPYFLTRRQLKSFNQPKTYSSLLHNVISN
jgi:filamentous hemagglutinin family protein